MNNKNLLILGSGAHSEVVLEIALSLNYFDKISFLDDFHTGKNIIGTFKDIHLLKNQYSFVFPGFGDNRKRYHILKGLEGTPYVIPTLIHPTAYISPSAQIGIGTLVEPKAVVNSHTTISPYCIIGIGAMIDHNCHVQKSCHIDCGAIVSPYSTVPAFFKVDAGKIINAMGEYK